VSLDELWKSFSSYSTAQIAGVLVVVAIIALMFLVRHLSAPGTAKLAAEQSERSEALDVLQGQIELLREDKRHQDARMADAYKRIESLEKDRLRDARYEQDYRHALGNRVQAFMLCYDAAHELLTRIAERWNEMPGDLRAEIRALPKAAEVDRRNPLPSRETNRIKHAGE
jgi:ABC-type transport system involved in cytochrome bd biosynthesis fused ATPase/permease subunit